ncbi:MAG: serine/threonine-protein phosphatase [Clostridia bacterium]|nr:serine/threonine-protein phosphatase [Clostridia bacterium]
MNFLKVAHTDVGIKKKTNQDSVLIQEASTDYGQVILAVVCDGMGGLSKGEVASSTVIKALSEWFETEFADILYNGMDADSLRISLENFIYRMNDKIQSYSKRNGCAMGTTFVALFIVGDKYYILNVGDSRAYRIRDSFEQLTKDQTYIQREMDMGRMTPEEAEKDPQRNVLLQCVGASNYIAPDFYAGDVLPGDCFLVCSDGFRHVIAPSEFYEYLNPGVINNEEIMKQMLEYFVDLNKYRRENDNISAALIKTY